MDTAGAPGGADQDVQYNSSGSFAGNSGFTYDGTDVNIANNLTLGGSLQNIGGNITFDNTTFHSLGIATSANDTLGRQLRVSAGSGGASTTADGQNGGPLILNSGSGGLSTSGSNDGGDGGTLQVRAGNGGNTTGPTGGDGGDIFIDGGQPGSGTGSPGSPGNIWIGQSGAQDVRIGSTSPSNMTGQVQVYAGPNRVSSFYVRDNTAGATYLNIDTATGSERVDIGNGVTNPNIDLAGTGAITIGDTGGSVGFLGAAAALRQSITGALSAVTDANAAAVLTSIISALTTFGLATDSTT